MRNVLLGLLAGALLATTGIGLAASAAKPQEIQQPTVEGTPRKGETLRAGTGGWANNPTSFSYQWQRCDANGQSCTNIPGPDATDNTYTLTAADVGNTVRALVTATNAEGSTTANTKPTAVVSDTVAPSVKTEPTISGEARVGATLTAHEGTWNGGPTSYAYSWRRCDANGANCVAVAGATGKTYGVRSEDVGHRLRVYITASNPYGSATKESNGTAVVTAASSAPPAATATQVSVANVSLPDRLIISAVSFQPSVITSRTTPVTARFRVTDTKGRAVQGALVYATGLPYGRVAAMGEVPTDAQGWATLTVTPTTKMPLQRGASIVFFVRARKPNEDLLAGVSTRRLVQVRIDPTR
jgi:hypothetical protein